MNFTTYSVSDLPSDESQQAQVADTSSEAEHFRLTWLARHRTPQAIADQAYAFVQVLGPNSLCPVLIGLKHQGQLHLQQVLAALTAPSATGQHVEGSPIGRAELIGVDQGYCPYPVGYRLGQQRSLIPSDADDSVMVLNRTTLPTRAAPRRRKVADEGGLLPASILVDSGRAPNCRGVSQYPIGDVRGELNIAVLST
jgi:hypothetical protein